MKTNLCWMLGSLAAYAVILVLSIRALAYVNGPEGLRIAITLAPMIPALVVAAVILRTLNRIDEFQRKLQLDAFAMAFAGTALITFSYGFLENVGFAKLSMFVVWPLMASLWICGLVIGHLRHR